MVRRITAKTIRYLDQRVPGQDIPRVLTAIRDAVEDPGTPWVAPPPRIDPSGRRLDLRDRRTGILPALGAIGWFATLVFLYAVPAIFAFAGFMSVVDSL